MEQQPFRVAVIGACGGQGRRHIAACQALGLAIPFVLDRNPCLPDFAAEISSSPLLSHHELTPDRVDGAIVSLPPAEHPQFSSELLRAGIPVLCEKPIAPYLAAAEPVVRAVEESHLPLLVGFHNRFSPVFLRLKALIAEGRLGRLYEASVRSRYWVAGAGNWRHDPGGGVLQNNGIHYLDLIPWLTGARPMDVVAAHADTRYVESAAEDSVTALIKLEPDLLFSLVCSWWPYGFDVQLEVVGSVAKATVVGWDAGEILLSDHAGVQRLTLPPYDRNDVLQAEIAEFVSSVRAARTPSVGLDAAMAATGLADEVLRVARLRAEPRPAWL